MSPKTRINRQRIAVEKFMPVLVFGVVSFLIFLTVGALGIWAVMKEQKQEHSERDNKARS
jgi:hypothetical protein